MKNTDFMSFFIKWLSCRHLECIMSDLCWCHYFNPLPASLSIRASSVALYLPSHTHTGVIAEGCWTWVSSISRPLSSCMRGSQLSLPCRYDHDPLSAPWTPPGMCSREVTGRRETRSSAQLSEGRTIWLLVSWETIPPLCRQSVTPSMMWKAQVLNAALTRVETCTLWYRFCSKCPLHTLNSNLVGGFFLPLLLKWLSRASIKFINLVLQLVLCQSPSPNKSN